MKIKPRRNKKSPLTVEGEVPLSQGESLKLKISAPPETWETLYGLSSGRPEYVGNLIWLNFAKPASDHLNSPRPRGVHKGRDKFMFKMKELIPYVYYCVAYWLKEPQESWPKDFKKIIEKDENNFFGFSNRGKRKSYLPHEVTAYLMEKTYGEEREKNRLKPWTDDPETFRKTFISDNELAKGFKAKPKDFLKDFSPISFLGTP